MSKIFAFEAHNISKNNLEKLKAEQEKELLIALENVFSEIRFSAQKGEFEALPDCPTKFMHRVKSELESCGYMVFLAGSYMLVSWKNEDKKHSLV